MARVTRECSAHDEVRFAMRERDLAWFLVRCWLERLSGWYTDHRAAEFSNRNKGLLTPDLVLTILNVGSRRASNSQCCDGFRWQKSEFLRQAYYHGYRQVHDTSSGKHWLRA